MDTREIAANILAQLLNSGNDYGFEAIAESQARAFAKRLVLTALRRLEYLKKVISGYSLKKLPQKLSKIHLLIILGAVEILYFDTPEYAAVNSYVALAKKKDKYAGGFVNAVLRQICRNRQQILGAAQQPFFPPSFYKLLAQDYSNDEIKAIAANAETVPPLDLTVKDKLSLWAEKLSARIRPDMGLRLFDSAVVSNLAGYDEGAWWVQDMASSLAVKALGDIRKKSILDLCAAPGGKTAQLINGGARVEAVDISRLRLDILEENLKRLNLHAERIICQDALLFLQDCKSYDIILLDAPCSATGTLRRHPEIIHNRGENDVKACADLQKRLLSAAAQKVKPEGILLYAVCSLCKLEGEKQIADFIKNNRDFAVLPVKLSDIAPDNPKDMPSIITPEGFIRTLPSYYGGMDGFFIAQLKKVKNHE
ncbi:MAG: MFS transporter [Alphaproteobacteria bacterium]|nr:MFS transporter [Alphaproteobacteria bacterium]